MVSKLKAALAAAAIAVIAACGGGGGAEGGIGGTGGGGGGGTGGVSVGTITDFGSVWVNGVEFSTTNATIRIDDNPGRESDLRRGMVVRVDGSISGATASTITVDDAVKGFVEAVPDSNTLVVMGQTITIDAATRFDNNVRPARGDRVDVHGLVAGDGVINAGYIEVKTTAPTPPFVVKGLVKAHDTAAQTFQVGTLTVRYSGATVNDMPAGSWNGLQVDAKGSACAGSPVCGTLTASKVEPAGTTVASASAAEIEGIVTAISANGFSIGNQAVVTTGSTRYENGTAADLALGVKVEAEGAISGGVLTATKVEFKDAVRLEGDVATVNGTAGTFTITGLGGVTIAANAGTEFKSISSVAGLAAPNHVRVRGRLGANNTVIATEIERRSTSSDTRVILQSSVSAFTAGTSVTLLGVTVNTAGVSQFRDASDAAITSQAFYAGIRVGSIVKVRGDLAGLGIGWSEVEIEKP